MKPIIFIPSPRDIPEFKEYTDRIELPKLWMKYYDQTTAYNIARNWFLEHEEYTHLIILPDDLLATQDQIELLLSHNLDIVSGWCSVDKKTNYANISKFVPPLYPSTYEEYKFITITEAESIRDIHKMVGSGSLLPVSYSGFALTIISRDIVETIPFGDGCIDNAFARELSYRSIIQYVDLDVRCEHLKVEETAEWFSNLLVGKKTKEIIYPDCEVEQ